MEFPAEGKIFAFFPVAANDFWFTINQVNYTCMLYHYKDGKTESVKPPFSNHISSINFFSADSALFSSFAELVLYTDGKFSELPPAPVKYVVVKSVASGSSFYLRTNPGEMFRLRYGKFDQISPEDLVSDFCFDSKGRGYLVTKNQLQLLNGLERTVLLVDSLFSEVKRIVALPDGSLIMVGRKGLVIRYKENKIERMETGITEDLSDLAVGNDGEVWICGDNGRLLYHGLKKFPEYAGNEQGFSSYKLITYGISTDDEYGVALADFNGDDYDEIYAVRIYEQNRLYINDLENYLKVDAFQGFFEESVRRNAHGVVNPDESDDYGDLKLGVAVADIDNDEDQDIYLCYLNSTNKLLLNTGRGYFRNVSEQQNRACLNMNRSNTAAFADIDLDGDLDLFVANEEGSNRLFENNGTGSFADITDGSGLETAMHGMCASFSDFNHDGYPDLCATLWYSNARLYVNETGKGKISFRDISDMTDLAKAPETKNNGINFGDINNDGSDDLLIASRDFGCRLYLNDGNGLFRDQTEKYFTPMKRMANGLALADFDLDGFMDLYLTCVGENVLYKNVEGQYFQDVTSRYGAELSGYSTGCAVGDVDNDGDPDLYVANYVDGNSMLFLNNTGSRSYIKIRLRGVRSNKDAIGTKVWLFENHADSGSSLAAYRELRAGEGYGSVNAKEMIFGVDSRSTFTAVVKFPCSADTLRYEGLTPGVVIDINEDEGFTALRLNALAGAERFFLDQEYRPEIIKYLLIIILLLAYNRIQYKKLKKFGFIRWIASLSIFLIFVIVNSFFLYEGLRFSFFTGPLVFVGLLALFHLVTIRMMLRSQLRTEKLELREKLSRDLHDDLASTLGSISIYAGTLNRILEPASSDHKKLTQKITSLTQSALQSISEIIWMTSPRNDTLQSLISKTSNYMLELLTDNRIRFVPDVNIPDEAAVLPDKVRNDTFLILKEGLHNVIRHSGADTVRFVVRTSAARCYITLKDNGVGMPYGKNSQISGNGLMNMKKRAEESGVSFRIHSSPGNGVEILLEFQI